MNGNSGGNMEILIFLSSIVLAYAAVSVNPSPRSVNVALETSFLFEPKDINDNISFIQNIKVFLDKLYKILAPQAQEIQQFRAQAQNQKGERKNFFSDFMRNVGEIFLNLTSEKANDAVKILDVEVNKIADQSKVTFKGILPEKEIKKYVKDSVGQWVKTDAEELKSSIKKIMSEGNPLLNSFAKRMNDYYTDEDIKKLNKFLKKLHKYFKHDLDPSQVVQDALQFGITEKFKTLNATSRATLMNDMKLLSDFITENKKQKHKHDGRKRSSLKRNNIDIDLFDSDKETHGISNDSVEKDEIYNELKKTIGMKLKLAGDRMKENDKKGVNNPNEIIVDNVELFVQSLKKP